jgi:hypothetical protein
MRGRVLLAVAVLALTLAPPAAAADVTAPTTDTGAAPLTAAQAPSLGVQENATETATPPPNESDTDEERPAGPSTAETVRILPVQFEAEYLSIETAETAEAYNTSGPHALFQFSEPVEQAAVQQPGASATVLDGGHVVKVEYAPDAAPVGEQSLYKLNLYFADDSSRTVTLYAERTSVDVGGAEMKKYRPLIMKVLEDAESAGYERSPAGAEAHYAEQKETAQLLDNLFTEQAARLFASLISIVANPLGIALLLISASLIALWQLRRNREALDLLTNDSGKASRLRERLWIAYHNAQQTAAEEPLRELQGVGDMGEIYWRDAFGVDTTAGLAELFRQGLPVERDGEVEHIGGVVELDAEDIHASWIEAVCRDHRLPSPDIALAHGKAALHRMISKYGQAHHYQETYEAVRELIDELDETRDVQRHSGRRSAGGGLSGSSSPGAVGGDD